MAMNYQAAVNISAQFTGQNAVDQAKRSLNDVKNATSQTSGSVNELTGLLKKLGAAYAIKEVVSYGKGIIDLADSLNDLRQKTGINVQTLSALKTAGELGGVAFEAMQTSIGKFAVNVSKASNGNREAEAAFKSLGISIKTTSDASDVLHQVSDAFAKMPNGPNKASIAVALFGKAGRDLIPVLNEGGASLDKFGLKISDDFAKRADHFNDTLTLMRVQTQQFAADAIKDLLPTLQEIADAFTEFNKSGETSAFKDVADALRVIVVVGTAAFTVFSEAFDELKTLFEAAGEYIGSLASQIVDQVTTIGAAVKAAVKLNFDEVTRLNNEFYQRKLERDKAYNEAVSKLDADLGKRQEERFAKQTALQNKLLKNFGNPDQAAKDTAPQGNRKPSAGFGDSDALNADIRAIEDRVKKIRAEAVELNSSNAEKRTAIELAELNTKSIDKNSAAYARLAKGLKDAVYAAELAKEKQAAADYTQKQKEQLDLQKLEIEQVNYSALEYQKLVEAKKQDLEVTEATKRMTPEGAKAYRDAAAAIREQREALDDLKQAQKESFGQGAKEAWKDYLENAKDVASQTKSMFSRAFSNMEDAIVNFVKTGKLNFADLADQIESDLIRIAVRQAVVFGATAAFGGASYSAAFANGGIMTGSGPAPLHKYASGGIANSPQLALFGEGSKPEAYVPLPDGRTIPVTMKGHGAQGGGGTSVVVNVEINNDGSQSGGSQSDSDRGKQLGNLISTAVTAEIIKQKRPGGLLA